ncbi:MAG: flippase-like domain-containing protein, partial [Actinobacteria bacterium]
AGALVALVWWRGPNWHLVKHSFDAVRWYWVFAAIGLNLLSVVMRAIAWRIVITQAMPPPHPRFPLVFSAFSVGLFANAVLPGRIGELARVAVLTRKLRVQGRADGIWAALVGSVFAHRLFDLVPTVGLIVYVLFTAKIPHWAISSLIIVGAIGFGLFAM